MIMFQRLLLFERTGVNQPQQIGSLIIINQKDGIVVAARELIPSFGKTFLVSLDGTHKNLHEVEAIKEVPIPGIRVEPFVYLIRLKTRLQELS